MEELNALTEQEATLGEQLQGTAYPTPEEACLKQFEQEAVRKAFNSLPQKFRHIITRRWGLDGKKIETISEIAERLGVSHGSVQDAMCQGTSLLREKLSEVK